MKKIIFRRGLALTLAVLMFAIPLSGCGKKGGDTEQDKELSEFVYVPTAVKLPDEIDYVSSQISAHEDTIVFAKDMPIKADGNIATKEEAEENQKQWDEYYKNTEGTIGIPEVAPKVEAQSTTDTSIATAPVNKVPEPESFTYEQRLFKIKMDATGYEMLENYVPVKREDEYSYVNIDSLCLDAQGNIWTLMRDSRTIFDLPDNFDPETQDRWEYYVNDVNYFTLRELDSTGKEIKNINLNELLNIKEDDMNSGVAGIEIDSKGNVFVGLSDGAVAVLDSEGNVSFKLESKADYGYGMTKLSGDVIAMNTGSDNGGNVLMTINTEGKTWDKEIKLPMEAWQVMPGVEGYDICFNDANALYGYKAKEEKKEKILSWLDSDINPDHVSTVLFKENGDIFVVANVYEDIPDGGSSESHSEFITLVKTPRSDVKQKTVLTYATRGLDWTVRDQILKFNKKNPDYRIVIKDYSEYDNEDNWNAGLMKLNTEIISGNIPDIIQLDGLPASQYASKGILTDLYPFIDGDKDFKREDFFANVLKALEFDGKLPRIGTSFGVMSLVGASSVVGDEEGWTIQEMMDVIKAHPDADVPLGMYIAREEAFQTFLGLSMQDFVNWETGECSFDTPEFKALLEFSNIFPEEIDWENTQRVDPNELLRQGRQILMPFDISDLIWDNAELKFGFGEQPFTFKGFPNKDRSGNVIDVRSTIGISSKCENKEAAWEFVKTLLSESAQKQVWDIPIVSKYFDKKVEEACKQEYDSEGNPISMGGMSDDNGNEYQVYALTEEEAQMFKDIVSSASHLFETDENLLKIIKEESAAYFEGEKSVDEVAAIIQSRMNIYVNEQR